MKPLSQAEEVLNWQTENSLAQNSLLTKINHKVDGLMTAVEQGLGILSKKLQKYYKETGQNRSLRNGNLTTPCLEYP